LKVFQDKKAILKLTIANPIHVLMLIDCIQDSSFFILVFKPLKSRKVTPLKKVETLGSVLGRKLSVTPFCPLLPRDNQINFCDRAFQAFFYTYKRRI
jgi:hypothetical protein